MSGFFAMGGYAAFVWPVVGASLVGLVALYLQSARAHKRFEKEDEE